MTRWSPIEILNVKIFNSNRETEDYFNIKLKNLDTKEEIIDIMAFHSMILVGTWDNICSSNLYNAELLS